MTIKNFFRGIVASVAAVATFYFVGWVGAALLSILVPGDVAFVLSFLASAVMAVLVARHVWRSLSARGRGPATALVGHVAAGAAVVGGIAFCAGFFGPMIFAPGANQGPLLGLFITGPLGIVAGAVGGWLYGLHQGRTR